MKGTFEKPQSRQVTQGGGESKTARVLRAKAGQGAARTTATISISVSFAVCVTRSVFSTARGLTSLTVLPFWSFLASSGHGICPVAILNSSSGVVVRP